MGRGKIEIKRIENATNRQVTYSKRRTGIMKKARELTVLCDAQVAIIMFSSTGKYHEFCSPGTDIKTIFDRYQQAIGTSLWNEQYENMQRTLSHLKDINRNLRTEIRQRMGEDLDSLEFDELRGLEQNVDAALKEVRQRKYHVITTQTETYKKKGMREDPAFGFVDNTEAGGGGWDAGGSVVTSLGGGAADSMFSSFRVVPSQPNLHGMAYGSHELRLG
ncbi:hypothetical protein BS78_10G275200 [Paspalum vaginatum]|nr:hypothetical protein BS78_10G275200 [Paspalum vaginatum]